MTISAEEFPHNCLDALASRAVTPQEVAEPGPSQF